MIGRLILVLLIAGGLAIVLDDLHAEADIAAESQIKAADSKAAVYAAFLAACLGGNATLTISDEPVAECRKLRKR